MGMTLFFFSLGFNWVVTLTLLGEIFSPSIKGLATSIATDIWYNNWDDNNILNYYSKL